MCLGSGRTMGVGSKEGWKDRRETKTTYTCHPATPVFLMTFFFFFFLFFFTGPGDIRVRCDSSHKFLQ